MAKSAKLKNISSVERQKLYRADMRKSDDIWLRIGNDFAGGISRIADETGIERRRLVEILAQNAAFERLLPEEADKLFAKGIRNVQHLWAQIGKDKDFDEGINALATSTGVDRGRLLTFITDQADKEADVEESPWLKGRWLDTVLECPWLKRHWLDSVLGVFLFLLIILFLRALGIFALVGLPLGLHATVVARSNIASGEIITPDTIAVSWSGYHAGTAVKTDQIIGHKAKRDIRKGELILREFVEPELMLAKQVVVKAPTGLPAFHILAHEDIEVKEIPIVPEAFNKPEEMIGRFLLESVPQGAILRAEQLSDIRLSHQEMAGRQLLILPVRVETLIPAIKPKAHVSLLFSPQEHTVHTSQPFFLRDVLVLAVHRHGESASIVVAINQDALEKVIPLVGTSGVFILQPVP